MIESLKIWILASRPKTLGAAIAPVIIGTAMAYADDQFHLWAALGALFGAILIQIGTNFANDYADFKKGTDTVNRLGPTRVTQAGLVAPNQIKLATLIAYGLAFLIGIYLVYRGGWPVVLIGLTSLLFGYLYTGGPYPLAYIGLADLFVLIYFGPVAVGGTYYVQTLSINWMVIVAGLAPGLFSVAILTINNLRDIDEDRRGNKKTLAVRFGAAYARYQYMNCLVLACLVPIFLTQAIDAHFYAGGTPLIILLAKSTIRSVFQNPPGVFLNGVLAKTSLFLLLYSLMFSIGWNLVPVF